MNYPERADIYNELNRYSLKSGIYESDDKRQVSYLLYTPKAKASEKVPLVLFISGSGEIGRDLSKQFRQRTIFETICNSEFQEDKPCYLLVLSPPDGTTSLLGGLPGKPSPDQQLLFDALETVASSCKKPPVDTERLYATGLSFGGNGVYALALRFPGLFAAVVPVASVVVDSEPLPDSLKSSFWHLYNEGDYKSNGINPERLYRFAEGVRERGNDFRIGTFPDMGHNAWDKAWREESLWNWVFSKKIGGVVALSGNRTSRRSSAKKDKVKDEPVVSSQIIAPLCTASLDGIDEAHTAGYGADGLDATAYISVLPLKPGAWWKIEFQEPVSGTITIKTGLLQGKTRDEKMILSRGRVDVSYDGKIWRQAGIFSRKNGECVFTARKPIKALRVTSETKSPLVIRECVVTP